MEHSLPTVSPFLELVERHKRNSEKIILRDHSLGVSATAGKLLYSVCLLREKVRNALLQNAMYHKGNGDRGSFIFMIAPPGWEYVVSMLTIFSFGAAISAQSVVVRPEDIKHYFKLARPYALLFAPALEEKAEAIKALCAEKDSGINPRLPFVKIETSVSDHDYKSHTFEIDANNTPDPTRTGSLFFTSGTSGNQKGVVHTFEALLASARERVGTWKLTEDDVVLNQKPGNWMGGIFGIVPSLIAGACLETCAGVFNPDFFWKRISQGGVSVFDIAPTGYDRLLQHFEQNIAILPHDEKEKHIKGMIEARVAGVSGSLLQPHTQKAWTELRRGKPLLNLYGSTEMTLMCSMKWEDPRYEDMCSIGQPVSGVEMKLLDGEIRVRSPAMFSRYLSDDPTITQRAFDSEGFFKTGDCAEKIGDSYKLYGRANIDVLHFWGITLHTGEVETALFSLPYILNAVVLPIEDDEYQERAAAILEIRPSFKSQKPGIQTLRNDLSAKTGLMEFKLPTVAYWLQDGEEISLTANGKISKVDARKKFFGENWQNNEKIEVLDLKGMEYWRMGGQC